MMPMMYTRHGCVTCQMQPLTRGIGRMQSCRPLKLACLQPPRACCGPQARRAAMAVLDWLPWADERNRAGGAATPLSHSARLFGSAQQSALAQQARVLELRNEFCQATAIGTAQGFGGLAAGRNGFHP